MKGNLTGERVRKGIALREKAEARGKGNHVEAKGKEDLACTQWLVLENRARSEQPERTHLEVGKLNDALGGGIMPTGRGKFFLLQHGQSEETRAKGQVAIPSSISSGLSFLHTPCPGIYPSPCQGGSFCTACSGLSEHPPPPRI